MHGKSLVSTILLTFLVAGCARKPPQDQANLVPVTGTVKLGGKVLPGALVSFSPAPNTIGIAASGFTKDDGGYELTNVRSNKGLSPGDYLVTISRRVLPDGKVVPPDDPTPPIDSKAKESIQAKYSSLEQTILRKKIEPGGGPWNIDLE